MKKEAKEWKSDQKEKKLTLLAFAPYDHFFFLFHEKGEKSS